VRYKIKARVGGFERRSHTNSCKSLSSVIILRTITLTQQRNLPTLTAVFASSSLALLVAPSVMRLELRFERCIIAMEGGRGGWPAIVLGGLEVVGEVGGSMIVVPFADARDRDRALGVSNLGLIHAAYRSDCGWSRCFVGVNAATG